MAFITLKPARTGLIVRHPGNMRLLNPAGEEVEHNSYWERRIKDKDVIVIETESSSKDVINHVSTAGTVSPVETKNAKNKKTEDNS